jgi:hypothetical protein
MKYGAVAEMTRNVGGIWNMLIKQWLRADKGLFSGFMVGVETNKFLPQTISLLLSVTQDLRMFVCQSYVE